MGVLQQGALAAADPGNTTVPLPTTTEPEALHLTWGADPKTQVTVSWSAPGTVAQPAPTLTVSDKPLTARNRGQVLRLPNPEPLSLKEVRFGPQAVSFTDNLSGETTYHYHVPLEFLRPDTTYYYEVSDGAASTKSRVVQDRPGGPREVPVLQLRRHRHPDVRQQVQRDRLLVELRGVPGHVHVRGRRHDQRQ